jgi:hypothetical protein
MKMSTIQTHVGDPGFVVEELDGPPRTGSGIGGRGSVRRSGTDSTGHAYENGIRAKQSYVGAVERTIADLKAGNSIEIIELPGQGGSYAVPAVAARFLRGELVAPKPAQR